MKKKKEKKVQQTLKKYLKNNDTQVAILQLLEIFDCKLLALNKAHPRVPFVEQMRPITVTNVVFKILESRFNEDLQEAFFKLDRFAMSQHVFLKGLTTQTQNLEFSLSNDARLGKTQKLKLKPFNIQQISTQKLFDIFGLQPSLQFR
ncbi:MAG TPA: hypothetical protein PLS50_05665 [Candidatus Dojkabacteria bacterium]|nr:hypothetical protein [Candidatus Dojkabacteria bacterium]